MFNFKAVSPKKLADLRHSLCIEISGDYPLSKLKMLSHYFSQLVLFPTRK